MSRKENSKNKKSPMIRVFRLLPPSSSMVFIQHFYPTSDVGFCMYYCNSTVVQEGEDEKNENNPHSFETMRVTQRAFECHFSLLCPAKARRAKAGFGRGAILF
ncbi:MAG: hypothetical protein HY001_03940 [Candidatus Portnoybacteria bacterium]|nr:hypothetical protein [Candidatus Portnoybacteria bacterium]